MKKPVYNHAMGREILDKWKGKLDTGKKKNKKASEYKQWLTGEGPIYRDLNTGKLFCKEFTESRVMDNGTIEERPGTLLWLRSDIGVKHKKPDLKAVS